MDLFLDLLEDLYQMTEDPNLIGLEGGGGGLGED